MRVVVTCGPSHEPIDHVRRLTNFSTGELGILLANRLSDAGCEVVCFKGAGATCPVRVNDARVSTFGTNDHLLAKLRRMEGRDEVAAVFHAAALADFKVKELRGATGCGIEAAKISSRDGELTIVLEPATKLIAGLRELFPASRIVGWKYELEGTREGVLAKAARQMAENGTDVCVANGAAYGPGFGVLEKFGAFTHVATKRELCEFFAAWISR